MRKIILKRICTFLIILGLVLIPISLSKYTTSYSQEIHLNIIKQVYTVIFDANGGTGTMTNQEIIINTDTNLKPNEFTRQDYAFAGWNTQADGEGTAYADEASVRNLAAQDSSITLYAQWEEIQGVAEINGQYYETIAAAINACGGTQSKPATTPTTIRILCDVVENITIPKGKNIILNLNTHTLSNSSDDKGLIENNGTLVVTNGTLTKGTSSQHALINNNPGAHLEVVDATLTSRGTNKAQAIYNNGGTTIVSGNSILTSESTNRATINTLNSSGNTGVLEIRGGTIISPSYSAVVCAGGTVIVGTEGAPADTTSPVLQGKIYGLDNSTNNDIHFYDGICKGETRGINQPIPTSNIEPACSIVTGTEGTYKTAYLVPSNTITFDPNLGTTSEPTRYRETGAELGTLPTATREGYTFIGWFTDPDVGTEISPNTIVSGDDRYYAHWIQKKEITFNANGGTVNEATRYVDDGEEIGELPVPEYSNHRFDGWFTEQTGGTQITSSTVITDDDEFFAHWTEIYLVKFDVNGGKVTATDRQIEHGSQVGELPIPTKTNSTFLGWFTERTGGTQVIDTTVITANTTLYAHWNGPEVAKVGDVHYATLQDAIDSAEAGGPEIKVELLTDVTANVIIGANQSVELDFGSYTLTAGTKTKDDSQAVRNYGNLRITGGTITSSQQTAAINNEAGGIAIISGGSIIATGLRQAIYNQGGNLEITGTAYLSSANMETDKVRGTVQNVQNGIITITGGTIVATVETAVHNEKGTMTIGKNDSNVSSSTPIIQGTKKGVKNSGTLNFYDGIVKVPTGQVLFDGNITNVPLGYEIIYGTESSYDTAYLSNEIQIPVAVTGLVYDGTSQTGVVASGDNYTLTGNTATSAGTHTATASLNYPNKSTWSDGTTADKSITYTIDCATLTPIATADNKVYDGTTAGTGTISLAGVISGDTVTASATSFTFASPEIGTGITVTASGITISGADAANYELSSTTAETTADITGTRNNTQSMPNTLNATMGINNDKNIKIINDTKNLDNAQDTQTETTEQVKDEEIEADETKDLNNGQNTQIETIEQGKDEENQTSIKANEIKGLDNTQGTQLENIEHSKE